MGIAGIGVALFLVTRDGLRGVPREPMVGELATAAALCGDVGAGSTLS